MAVRRAEAEPLLASNPSPPTKAWREGRFLVCPFGGFETLNIKPHESFGLVPQMKDHFVQVCWFPCGFPQKPPNGWRGVSLFANLGLPDSRESQQDT